MNTISMYIIDIVEKVEKLLIGRKSLRVRKKWINEIRYKKFNLKKFNLKDLCKYQKNSIVSQTFINKKMGLLHYFLLINDKGLGENYAPYDALVFLIGLRGWCYNEERII